MGPGTAPRSDRCRRSAPHRSGRRATVAPSRTSECPESSLVALCTTTSAPSSSGRWCSGVAYVLSTATSAPRSPRARSERAQVGDPVARVRRRLEPQQRRAVARGERGVRVDDVGEVDVPPAVGSDAGGEQRARPRVAVGDDDLRARRQRLEDGGDGGHPGREGERLAALEPAEHVLERVPRRVPVAAVRDGAAGVVRRREHDGRVERGVGRVGRAAGADGHGLGGEHPGRVVDVDRPGGARVLALHAQQP